jgi:hypothetical protein
MPQDSTWPHKRHATKPIVKMADYACGYPPYENLRPSLTSSDSRFAWPGRHEPDIVAPITHDANSAPPKMFDLAPAEWHCDIAGLTSMKDQRG